MFLLSSLLLNRRHRYKHLRSRMLDRNSRSDNQLRLDSLQVLANRHTLVTTRLTSNNRNKAPNNLPSSPSPSSNPRQMHLRNLLKFLTLIIRTRILSTHLPRRTTRLLMKKRQRLRHLSLLPLLFLPRTNLPPLFLLNPLPLKLS